MNRKLRMVANTYLKNEDPREVVSEFTIDKIKRARRFISTFPEYSVTPLHELKNLAKEIGVGTIYLKDESHRFGLNSFKGLGGAWAMGLYLADRLGRDIDELSLDELLKPEIREKLGDITFYTATDGNQGRAIAWAARKFQQKAVVYMPKGSAQVRLDHILEQGAEASITEMNYDDSVRYASEMAEKNNGVMIQDTAWENYTDIRSISCRATASWHWKPWSRSGGPAGKRPPTCSCRPVSDPWQEPCRASSQPYTQTPARPPSSLSLMRPTAFTSLPHSIP